MTAKTNHDKPASSSRAHASRNALHDAHCKPLKGAVHRTDPADVERLLKQLPGWKLVAQGEAIEKTFTFEDYYRTLAFVNALAYVAHREDHHPDLGVHYNKCAVRYSTHDVGGLSMNDFICAAKAERLAADGA
jgi:4a-hydroxytetrahydrobiopterin dehydratase